MMDSKENNGVKNKNTKNVIFVKKFKLRPVAVPDNKNWVKRVHENFDYIINSQNKIISNYEEWLENVSEKRKDNYKNKLKTAVQKREDLVKQKSRFSFIIENNYDDASQSDKDFVKKIAKDYTYNIIRRACKSETLRKNSTLSYAYSQCIQQNVLGISDLRERNKAISEILKYCYRRKSSRNGSLLDDIEIDNPLGGYGLDYNQNLSSKFKDLVKKGLLEGKVALDCYKGDSPFTIASAHFSIIPNFDLIDFSDYKDLISELKGEDKRIFFCIGNNGTPSIAMMSFFLGSKGRKNTDLYSVLYNILNGEYSVGGSSIGIEDKDIILNLTIKKTVVVDTSLDENTVVGVDLGVNIPAMCALNNSNVNRLKLGSKDELLRMRTKINEQKNRFHDEMLMYRRAHKKNKKQQALKRVIKSNSHWKKTYNHVISKNIVEFALRNNAKFINLEDLSGFMKDSKTPNRILQDWSYYELQHYIEYKAEQHGIIVRYVNPSQTSNICSFCGHIDKSQRINKSIFICNNSDCAYFGEEFDSDFNAAKNIAKSTDFVSKNKKE